MSIKFTHATNFNVAELENKSFAIGEEVVGEPFVLVHKRTYLEFCVTLYPNGYNDDEGVFISLDSLNKDKNLKIRYRGAILLPDGSSHPIENWGWEEDCSLDGYGVGDFCTEPIASDLSEPKSKGLLMEDNTTLCVAVEMEIADPYFHIGEDMSKKISTLDFQDIGFWPKVYTKMMGGKDCSTDYELQCKNDEKQEFPIHKILAQERSQYFENLFGSHPSFQQEKSHKVDWSSAVIEEVRFFLYNDKASEKFPTVLLDELVQVAKMLELEKLVAICEESFMAGICKKNAWDFLTIADTLELEYLKKKALCILTEDPNLLENLLDDEKERKLRKEVGEFSLKRGRAQRLV